MKKIPLSFVFCYLVVLNVSCKEQQQSPKFDTLAPKGSIDLRIQLDTPKFGYQIKSEPHLVKAGAESYRCDIVKIEQASDEKLIWIQSFESLTSQFTHHMNVHVGTYSVADVYLGKGVGESLIGKKAGSYDCDELGDLMENGSYPVYPSQLTHQVAVLPSGIAIPSVVPLILIVEHHYINTGDNDVYINAAVNFHRVEEKDVEHVLTGFYGIGRNINIPPNSNKIHAQTCVIDRPITMTAISSHSHERGDCFTMNQYNNKTSAVEDEPFFVNPDWDKPPILFYDPETWKLQTGDGVHWACHYRNHEDRTVTNGLSADDEMCIFVGVGYPNRLTVDDIKRLADDPLSFDLQNLLNDALVSCDPVTAESPFPVVNTPIDDMEVCSGFEATLE